MQKINPNIEEDNFRKIMKEKLEGYSLPVNDDVWNKIEKNLGKKPRKAVLWPWISGTAVAAAVASFILLLNNYETTNSVSENTKTINKNVPVETISQPGSIAQVKPERIFVTKKTKGEYAEVNSHPEIDVVKEAEPTPQPPEGGEKKSPSGDLGVLSSSGGTKEGDAASSFAMTENNPFGEDSPPIKKSKKRKSIGLSLGSGGNLMAMNTNSDKLMTNSVFGQLRSNFNYAVESESKVGDQLLIEDFPEVNYRVPLSFGLTVKKELDRTFSLETGLVYTFLDSRFENRSLERKALLQLHYIGIPLNVQARILGNKKSDWEVYLSAGGMVEKGIYSHYKQMNYVNGNYVSEIISNERIDGLQYSLSLAPGVDYKIFRNYSIYVEPKISYYFDNGQPISARTEHPVVIGINAGLRLCW